MVFGGPAVGNSGLLALSSLNGANGFQLDGEASGDFSGFSVSAAGDMNGDGYADLLIGAYLHNGNIGRSYVVFGGPTVGNSGLLALSSLNGVNGFKLDGEASSDQSGCSVSAAGDMNGDGYADLVIGAYGHNGVTGRSYVVFGGPSVGSSGLLALSSLNGTNGFKLDGEASEDQSGISVSTAGDVNGDGYSDLLIGAHGFNSAIGCSYVVFGGVTVGSNGLLALSSLSGMNGFKLSGEASGDHSGYSVSAAGDMNGDGYSDLLVGAYGHNSNTGRSYMVFGGPSVGSSGVLALPNLNGINGFKLDGEASGDDSGYSVSTAGDINGDGVADLVIGANGHNSDTGRSYVVFGDALSLSANSLTINQNQALILSSQNLDGADVTHPISSISFIVNTVQHGQFTLVSAPGQAITQFTQSQVNAGQVQFVHDGSLSAPSFTVQVQGVTFVISSPQTATVTFYRQPILSSNSLSINQGQSVLFTPGFLNVINEDYSGNQVMFVISNLQHGQFQLLPAQTNVTQFTEQQLQNGQVQFVADGTASSPSYQVSVSDPYFTLAPAAAAVTFYRQPVLNNTLTINQGQSVVLTPSFLTHEDYPSDQVNFTVSSVEHGQFQLLPANTSVAQFTEQQLLSGQVQFVADGTTSSPSYQVGVSDPYFTLLPAPAMVTFYREPLLATITLP